MTKLIGWVVFFLGLIIVGSTVYYTYNIFTGVTPVPQIFSITFEEGSETEPQEEGLEAELRQMLSEQMKGLIPVESVNKFVNLFAWATGAWVIITGGSKISELGIKLVTAPSKEKA